MTDHGLRPGRFESDGHLNLSILVAASVSLVTPHHRIDLAGADSSSSTKHTVWVARGRQRPRLGSSLLLMMMTMTATTATTTMMVMLIMLMMVMMMVMMMMMLTDQYRQPLIR